MLFKVAHDTQGKSVLAELERDGVDTSFMVVSCFHFAFLRIGLKLKLLTGSMYVLVNIAGCRQMKLMMMFFLGLRLYSVACHPTGCQLKFCGMHFKPHY